MVAHRILIKKKTNWNKNARFLAATFSKKTIAADFKL